MVASASPLSLNAGVQTPGPPQSFYHRCDSRAIFENVCHTSGNHRCRSGYTLRCIAPG